MYHYRTPIRTTTVPGSTVPVKNGLYPQSFFDPLKRGNFHPSTKKILNLWNWNILNRAKLFLARWSTNRLLWQETILTQLFWYPYWNFVVWEIVALNFLPRWAGHSKKYRHTTIRKFVCLSRNLDNALIVDTPFFPQDFSQLPPTHSI
jgi:hypothetical protein